MDEDSFGLAMEKREGWAYCSRCQRGAPSREEIIHLLWCTPYEPSRWKRFVKRLDGLRFWEKGSWEVNFALVAGFVTVLLILWGSWELWRIFINYMVDCSCP